MDANRRKTLRAKTGLVHNMGGNMGGEHERLPEYRVKARNISADSDNKIHDDVVAAGYGFRGGLVPGVAVYAYMTVPVLKRLGPDWLERGAISVKFNRPFYEGELVRVRAEAAHQTQAARMEIGAERDNGEVCATAIASVPASTYPTPGGNLSDRFQSRPLPAPGFRLPAELESLVPGTPLGTLTEKLDLLNHQQTVLAAIDERLPLYFGRNAVAHPIITLSLANHVLMQNVALGPWIHTSSDVVNYGVARDGDVVTVRGRIDDCYERKGHEFVVLDLLLSVGKPIARVRHTAIYKIRRAANAD